jgi:hypothetical protein
MGEKNYTCVMTDEKPVSARVGVSQLLRPLYVSMMSHDLAYTTVYRREKISILPQISEENLLIF